MKMASHRRQNRLAILKPIVHLTTCTLTQRFLYYLINISKKEEVTDFLCNVSEDEKESGLGYDSDGDADEVLDVDIESKLARLFGLASITNHDAKENIEVDNNMAEFKKSFNKNVNPEILQIHCVPDDWEDPPPNVGKDEPPFESIDNSGEWSSFYFRPVFKKSAGSSRAKYQYHCLPTGCVPVEKDANGKRTDRKSTRLNSSHP